MGRHPGDRRGVRRRSARPASGLALQAARAAWGRDERQRSAVYTTTETVVEVFADPVGRASSESASATAATPGGPSTPVGCSTATTPCTSVRRRTTSAGCARCSPRWWPRSSRPPTQRSGRQGAPLDPPLLVVLDEAANVAPLAELDVLASTAAGHGVQLVTVWQDLAQLQARYGTRAGSVVNNHRVKVFLSGIADPGTLEHASSLIGETERRTLGDDPRTATGGLSHTDSPSLRRLVPADALRRIAPGDAVVVSGHLPPVRLRLRPWQDDRFLRSRAETGAGVSAPRW